MNKSNRTAANIIMTIIIIWLLIPLAATIIYSLFADWTGLVPEGVTLSSYVTIFTNQAFLTAIYQTLLICVVPILITILIVLLALFVVTIYFPQFEKYLQILCMIPYTIQGVILSVSILALYAGGTTVLSNRLVMLIGTYCIVILPYIYQGIRNSMHAVNMPMLLEAAEMLGSSKLYAFFRVIVPNIITGIVVSSLLAVGILFGDYVIIRNLSGNAVTNVQMYLYQAMKRSSTEASAVFVVIMMMTFIITAFVLYFQSKNKFEQAQKGGR